MGAEPHLDPPRDHHPLSLSPDPIHPAEPDRNNRDVEAAGQHRRTGLEALRVVTADSSSLGEDDQRPPGADQLAGVTEGLPCPGFPLWEREGVEESRDQVVVESVREPGAQAVRPGW